MSGDGEIEVYASTMPMGQGIATSYAQLVVDVFGVPIDNIIETGVAEIQALEGYIRAIAARTQKSVEESQKKIEGFEQSIKDLQAQMQKTVGEQQAVLKACNDKKLEVQHILEFFGQEAVAKVVQESPKLHSPDSVA